MATPQKPMPRDTLTGLPLPVLCRAGDKPPEGIWGQSCYGDLHHYNFLEEVFNASAQGAVTRVAYAHRDLPRWAHERYHEHVAPIQPFEDEREWLWNLMAAALKYRTKQAVRLPNDRRGDLEVVDLPINEQILLREKWGVHMASEGKVKYAILAWIVDHGLDITRERAEIFTRAKDEPSLYYDGCDIIQRACENALTPFRAAYTKAYSRGRLPIWASPDIGQAVLYALTHEEKDNARSMHAIGWLRDIIHAKLTDDEAVFDDGAAEVA